MYNNPGGTIKNIGKVFFIVGSISSVLFGFGIWLSGCQGNSSSSSGSQGVFIFFLGAIFMAIVIFFSYLANVFLVAFGELVENSTIIKNQLTMGQSQFIANNITNNSVQIPQPTKQKQCPICGAMNEYNSFTCSQCGFGLSGENSAAKPKAMPSSSIWLCSKCGFENVNGNYCSKCGNRKA